MPFWQIFNAGDKNGWNENQAPKSIYQAIYTSPPQYMFTVYMLRIPPKSDGCSDDYCNLMGTWYQNIVPLSHILKFIFQSQFILFHGNGYVIDQTTMW